MVGRRRRQDAVPEVEDVAGAPAPRPGAAARPRAITRATSRRMIGRVAEQDGRIEVALQRDAGAEPRAAPRSRPIRQSRPITSAPDVAAGLEPAAPPRPRSR